MRTLFVAIALLTGCSTSATFGQDAARVACQERQSCDPNAFDDTWDDLTECVETFDDVFGGDCFLEHCDGFDGQAANACLVEVRAQDCSDSSVPASCEDAWTDCRVIPLGICLVAAGADEFFGPSDD